MLCLNLDSNAQDGAPPHKEGNAKLSEKKRRFGASMNTDYLNQLFNLHFDKFALIGVQFARFMGNLNEINISVESHVIRTG